MQKVEGSAKGGLPPPTPRFSLANIVALAFPGRPSTRAASRRQAAQPAAKRSGAQAPTLTCAGGETWFQGAPAITGVMILLCQSGARVSYPEWLGARSFSVPLADMVRAVRDCRHPIGVADAASLGPGVYAGV